jgi:hypothetical protein
VVAERGWPPDMTTATLALGTTAPEGSVTWPRKVPVPDGAEDCASASAAGPANRIETEIAKIKMI